MPNFRSPKYLERYDDDIFDLDQALNATVAKNAHQKKNGYRFVVDNSGEVTPFDLYNARFSVNKLADGAAIFANDHNGTVNSSYSLIQKLDVKMNGVKILIAITLIML